MDIVDLIPEVGQIIRRCPKPILIAAYRRAARNFCAQSRWLRADAVLNTVDNYTTAGQQRYEVDISDPLNEVVGVRDIKGFEVGKPTNWWPVKPRDATLFIPTDNGQPTRYAYVPEGSIDLFMTPDKQYGMTIIAAVQPVIDADEISNTLITKWKETLEFGALSYLYGIGKQAWSNPEMAIVNMKKFQAGISNAKADEQRGFNQGAVRVRARRII